jgi:hypothetical protein
LLSSAHSFGGWAWGCADLVPRPAPFASKRIAVISQTNESQDVYFEETKKGFMFVTRY